MSGKPDTITVSAEQTADVSATGAELFLSVTGSSRVRADQAKLRAAEVNDLVARLNAIGVGEDRIEVQGVRFGTNRGRLTSSSHAIYDLRVRVDGLDSLPQIFDTVAGATHANLDRVAWQYPNEEGQSAALAAAIAEAKNKAAVVAQELDLELLGVHHFTESGHSSEIGPTPRVVARSVAAEDSPSLDLTIQHTIRRFVRVEVTFRVAAAPRGRV